MSNSFITNKDKFLSDIINGGIAILTMDLIATEPRSFLNSLYLQKT